MYIFERGREREEGGRDELCVYYIRERERFLMVEDAKRTGVSGEEVAKKVTHKFIIILISLQCFIVLFYAPNLQILADVATV